MPHSQDYATKICNEDMQGRDIYIYIYITRTEIFSPRSFVLHPDGYLIIDRLWRNVHPRFSLPHITELQENSYSQFVLQ